MMDVDDDPSDAESPVCVQRQTGCDDNVRFVSFPIKFINFQCTLNHVISGFITSLQVSDILQGQ